MEKRKKALILLITLAVLIPTLFFILLNTKKTDAEDLGNDLSWDEGNIQDLMFFVSIGTTYEVNETITIIMRILNPTDSTITLHFGSTYTSDYTIKSPDGIVYTWSQDKSFLQVLTDIRIYPHDSHVVIKRHTPEDYLLEPGHYDIECTVVDYFTDHATIEVLEP